MIHNSAFVERTAIIYPNVIIEEDVYIGPYCIIGAPAERDGDWEGKGVIIRKGAKLHGFNTVDAGTENPTEIDENTQLLKQAHVGHDAYIGKNCVLSCGSRIGGHAKLSDYCNIGLNASVHQWLEVPAGVMLGMNSCLTKKVHLESFVIYGGVPAKKIKTNQVGLNRMKW